MAIISFIPDLGHVQPLLKIADALAERGYEIRCYLSSECAPLLTQFPFQASYIDPVNLKDAKRRLASAFSRGVFFNRFSSYAHVNVHYLPEVMRVASQSAEAFKQRLVEQKPDVIIADNFAFSEWYARIGEELGVPVIINTNDGCLAGSQRAYVATFGLTSVPRAAQRAVEIFGNIHAKVYNVYYRAIHFRASIKARSGKRAARAALDAVFPKVPGPQRIVATVAIGGAAVEKRHFPGVVSDNGKLRAFFPLQFRSVLPMPDELRAWLDASKDEAIVYVSFGTIVELDRRFVTAVYEGLRRVRARVLWSMPLNQRELLKSVRPTENIRLKSFVPQPEVLQHPSVRCFLTQTGAWSMQEAWFGGTPMVCIPFFADQPYNASIVERLGVGRRLWQSQVSANRIQSFVTEILTDPKYLDRARQLSDELRACDGAKDIADFVGSLAYGKDKDCQETNSTA